MQSGMLVITDSDCGFTIDGVNYNFTDVNQVVIEDPEKTHLIRGNNSLSKTGLMISEGNANPKTLTFTLLDMSPAFFELLSETYRDKTRIDAWVVDRATGSHKTAKNAVIQTEPRQLTIAAGEENLKVEFAVESFDLVEQFKNAPASAPA